MSTGDRAARLDELARLWEEARRGGAPVSPEELCRDCPELLAPLREIAADLSRVDRALAGFFAPPPAESEPLGAGSEPAPGFVLVRPLGSGGFGTVWLAEAPGGFPVAVKIVRLDGSAGGAGGAEVRSLSVLRRLRHPNVLTTFGAWQTPGRLVLAMELADRTLMDRLREARAEGHPGIPGPELWGYLRGAARGLDYLNEPRPLTDGGPAVGVQHRDVKPQNLLLVGDTAKVGDFGLARALERTSAELSGGLTPVFAAPEFFSRHAARQSDQYSLAVSYCVLRGGRAPFTGSAVEIMGGHLSGDPDLSMLPEAERPAVARALSKRPEDRWPNCGAFAEAVERAGAALEVADTAAGFEPASVTLAVAPAPTAKRRRRAWLALPALAASAAAVLVFLAPAPDPEPVPEPTPVAEREVAPMPHFAPESLREAAPAPRLAAESGPAAKADPPGERLLAKRGAVYCCAWLPGGGSLLAGGAGGGLFLYDAASGKSRRLNGGSADVLCVAVSPDGKRALSGDGAGVVRFWNIEAAQPVEWKAMRRDTVAKGEKPAEVYGVAFDGAGFGLAAGNDPFVTRHDLATGAEVRRTQTQFGEVLAFARRPDGRRYLLGGAGGRVAEVAPPGSGPPLAEYAGLADDVLVAAYFRDGQGVAAAGGGDGGRPGRRDYRVLVADGGGVRFLGGHARQVTALAATPDGARLLSGDAGGSLILWDARAGAELRRFAAGSTVRSAAISPDGRRAAVGCFNGSLWLFELGE